MTQSKTALDAARSHAWQPYMPTPEQPWDVRRVVHLHRGAGFAAAWSEIERDLADGPEASVTRLISATGADSRSATDFEDVSGRLAEAAVRSAEPSRLKAWWMFRLLKSPDPLGERLTLMWHNHFATSNQKVNDLAAMHRQNVMFRRFARAPFGELLRSAIRDPALLVWLDAPANRRSHPNENLARELFELFTLGIGHYSESDVKEAARALTGWSVQADAFCFDAAEHDDGEKTCSGRSGRWQTDELVEVLLAHPATAGRLAWRLCATFLGEGVADRVAIAALADGLREHGLDIAWGIETVLRSNAFFATTSLSRRVLSPVEFIVGPVRALGMSQRPPSTLVLADWCARLGQDLFYPPNVGGWPDGRNWLGARAVVGRANFAAALVEGRPVGCSPPFDLALPAQRFRAQAGREGVVAFYSRLLLGREGESPWRDKLLNHSHSTATDADFARRTVATILTLPAAQVD